jgi:hypothetical protein
MAVAARKGSKIDAGRQFLRGDCGPQAAPWVRHPQGKIAAQAVLHRARGRQ